MFGCCERAVGPESRVVGSFYPARSKECTIQSEHQSSISCYHYKYGGQLDLFERELDEGPDFNCSGYAQDSN